MWQVTLTMTTTKWLVSQQNAHIYTSKQRICSETVTLFAVVKRRRRSSLDDVHQPFSNDLHQPQPVHASLLHWRNDLWRHRLWTVRIQRHCSFRFDSQLMKTTRKSYIIIDRIVKTLRNNLNLQRRMRNPRLSFFTLPWQNTTLPTWHLLLGATLRTGECLMLNMT